MRKNEKRSKNGLSSSQDHQTLYAGISHTHNKRMLRSLFSLYCSCFPAGARRRRSFRRLPLYVRHNSQWLSSPAQRCFGLRGPALSVRWRFIPDYRLGCRLWECGRATCFPQPRSLRGTLRRRMAEQKNRTNMRSIQTFPLLFLAHCS